MKKVAMATNFYWESDNYLARTFPILKHTLQFALGFASYSERRILCLHNYSRTSLDYTA